MRRLNYAILPEHPVDGPVYRKGRRPVKPKPRPYPKPPASVGVAAARAARRQLRQDARVIAPPPVFQDGVVFQDNYVLSVTTTQTTAIRRLNYALLPEHPIDGSVYRKGWRPVKSKPRPYPKPAASVGVAVARAARRQLREDTRLLAPPPVFQDGVVFQDNYVGFPPVIAGFVPEYGDDMQIDATGPFFTPVASNTAYVNLNPLPHCTATPLDNGIPLNGAVPCIQVIVGYVPELSENMDVDWEGPTIPTGNALGMTEAQYHPVFNGPPYAGAQVMAENVFAPHLGIAGNPYKPVINGPPHVQVAPNAFPPDAGIVDPPYDPREPLFPTQPPLPHLNGLQVIENNIFIGINVNAPAPAYPVQPPAPEVLNTPAIVTAEEHPGDREQLFNELFGNDGEEDEEAEEEEEAGNAPDPPWAGGGDLIGEHDDEDGDEDEVDVII